MIEHYAPRFLGSGTNQISRIGGIITEQSAVNAPNKSYILKATNVSGAEQLRIGLVISWREILTEV